mmetsp:Transcript_8310/g.18068  ORF Transcript_8310/g.18068 Transcript_8310/m.18068 type:complete len:1477 (-) Transcript_8310:75-4505(-)
MSSLDEESDLVSQWLSSANLSYAIPNFRMAGIVSPRSFVELELNYFEPLGVTKADDRKRLFYLIHKVKGVIEEDLKKKREGISMQGGGRVSGNEGKEEGASATDDDEYASEDFQSPNSNGVKEETARITRATPTAASTPKVSPITATYGGEGGGAERVMSTVEIRRAQPISPVTLSSPIASSEDGHHYLSSNGGGGTALLGVAEEISPVLSRRSSATTGFSAKSTATGDKSKGVRSSSTSTAGATGAQAAAAITSRPTSTSTRERLEKELELRALKRRQDKLMAQEKNREELDNCFGEEIGLDPVSTGDATKQKSIRRRQSSIPASIASGSGGGGGSSSISSITRRRKSSISSHRPSRHAVAAKKTRDDILELKQLEEVLDEKRMDNSNVYDEAYKMSDAETDDLLATTPKGSAVDVRSRNSSIGMHSRQTVKKTNATKKNRRLSSIPRAAPLLEEDEECSIASDLSASVQSSRSLGNSTGGSASRKSSIASASTAGTVSSLGSIHGNRVDENKNNSNHAEKKTSRKKHPLARGLGQRNSTAKGNNTSNSSVASSSSLRSNRTANTATAGKRLSTIPSSAVAPLSPLAGLSSTQLDRSMNANASTTQSLNGPRNSLRRRSSLGAGGKQSGLSSSSGRPGTADSNGSKKFLAKSHRSGGGPGSPGSIASNSSYPSQPSSRDRLRKKLNTSTSSNNSNHKTNTSGMSVSSSTSVRRRRLKSPSPRNRDAALARPRSKSPYSPSRGTTPPRSANRSTSPKRTPPQKMGVVGTRRTSPPRANRSVSPRRTQQHRAAAHSPPKLGVVGSRTLSPISSPNSRATSPNRSPRRAKSPINSNGAVFVHGAPTDDSWATQIGVLTQAFDDEHERVIGNRDAAAGHDEDEAMYEMRIRVIVRKRPMSTREAASAEVDVIQPLEYNDYGRVLVHQAKTKLDLAKEVETTAFAFDNVFNEHSNNVQIYERSVMSLIPGVFRGKWASVFAYGQTGSGKTFTMMGSNATGSRAGNQSSNISDANLGLYFLAAQDVFRIAENPAYADISIGVSLFEIYGGKLLDLLNARNPVRCLENSKGKVCFPGLSEHPVTNADELMDIIDAGALNRSTGTTSANADSSRSHAVLQLSLRKDVGRIKNKEHGRLTFIDLAGSERGADTSKACRTTRMEGAEINTSLLALKEVIRALATGSSLKRIPFRGSKLTQVLKESFVGKNSRTVMVSCVAPNLKNCDHTLNTLRYADRVKERDPKTGKLSASVAAYSKMKRDHEEDMIRVKLPPRPLTAPAKSFRIEREDEEDETDDDIPPPPSREEILLESLEEYTFVEEEDEKNDKSGHSAFNYDKIVESDENDSLDEALNSYDTPPAAAPHSHHESIAPRPPLSLKDNPAAQSLIATHKSIMSKLLQMLQHEMSLVNDTDANRENIDEYLKELDNISCQQLSLLSTLRESLLSYNASKDTNRSITWQDDTSKVGHLSNDDTTDYDDSFDLRD